MQIIEGGCYHLGDGLNGRPNPKISRKSIIFIAAFWVVMIIVLLYRF